MQRVPALYVAESQLEGRGVFTAVELPKGSVLEICPVIVCKAADRPALEKTDLNDYIFLWGKTDRLTAIALGYGSLYNHSFEPNAYYKANYEENTLSFYTLRDIEAGEEITVNYQGDPESEKPVWFI